MFKLSDLTSRYKGIADKALLKNNLEIGNFTISDLVKIKSEFDINEVITGASLKDEESMHLDYKKGVGIREDDQLSCFLESKDIFDTIVGNDSQYRYMSADDGSEKLTKVMVRYEKDTDGFYYVFYDFNTLEFADWNEIIDNDELNEFFGSATFLVAPGMEDIEAPHKYMWDDFSAVNDRIQEASNKNEPLYVYTLTEAEGAGYIDSGYRRVNRVAYFLADKEIPITDPLRYS